MADPFQPRFVDLVRNFSATTGTGNFVLGAAVAGFTSFSPAVLAGESFYYAAIGVDKPAEREIGRGTMQADGTISRQPISGALTDFTTGNKSIALIAAAEWYSLIQASSGTGSGGGTPNAASRAAMAAIPAPADGAACVLSEGGRSGLFVFSSSNRTSDVAADTLQGIYVAPSAAPSGAAGAWVRQGDRLTPSMFGGVQSVKAGNRITEVPNYTETMSDATAAVQAVFDMIKYEVNKAWTGDFSGFWGLSDPNGDGYCIVIDQPYYLVRRFIMGHFSAMLGATGTAVFKISNFAWNHSTEGRWEIWGQPDQWTDNYTGRTFKHGIECTALALWDIESIYCRGFKKWGVVMPAAPIDPNLNQNIAAKIGRLKANNCGSVPDRPSSRFSSTYSGGTRTGGSGGNNQRSNLILGTASAVTNHFEASDWVVIGGEPYEVMEIDAAANSISIFPWLPAGQEVSGTLYGLFGGGIACRGSDTATVKVELLDTLTCGFGFYSAGLYGMSVHCAMVQTGGAAMGIGVADGNTLGNSVLQAHWESNQFDLIARNVEGAQAYICGVQGIAGDDFNNPFKNCRAIRPNDGTALASTGAFPNISFNINGVDYHSGNGDSKSRAYTPTLSNDPRWNRISKVADSLAISLKYYEPVDRLFQGHFRAELEVVGTAGGAPTGEVSVALNAADAAAGITIEGGAGPYSIAAGAATGPVHLKLLLDTSGATRNWKVVPVSGVDAVGATAQWGAITGTLSNQADLNGALNARALLAGGNSFTGDQAIAGTVTVSDSALLIGSATHRIRMLEAGTNLYLQAGLVGAAAANGSFSFTGINGFDLISFTVGADQHIFNVGGTLRFYVTSAGAQVAGTLSATGNVTGANLSGSNSGDQIITLTGDVTGSGTGSFAATIGAGKVTYAKIQNVSAASLLLGRATTGAGAVEEIGLANGLAMAGTALGLGAITPSSVTTAGGITSSGTAGLGYSAGAGGAVTQTANKSTGVTLNKICGRVTMAGAALAASTSIAFTLTNSTIAATDAVVVNIASAGTASAYVVQVDAIAAGSCRIHVRNVSAGSLSEALVLNFAVLKSVIA